jgi:hypothetical protein
LNVTRVTLTPPMCQFLVRVCLANVVGEVTETLGVRDFGTSKDLGCSIVERPKRFEGRNHVASFRDFEISVLWEVSCVDSKETFNVEAPNSKFPASLHFRRGLIQSLDWLMDGRSLREVGIQEMILTR